MPDLMLLDVEGDSSQIQQKDIEKSRELGKGAYGQIFAGVWRGKEVAIKEIYLDRLPSDEERRKALNDFRAEIKIMR
jgi:predicted Ser/Thr protein kinase